MSYAICNVVVGCEMPSNLRRFVDEVNVDYESLGFHNFYTSGGPFPLVCGDTIYRFDECNTIKAEELIPKLRATPEQWWAAQQKMNKMKETVAKFLNDYPVHPHPDDEPKFTSTEIKEFLDEIPKTAECLLIWSSS